MSKIVSFAGFDTLFDVAPFYRAIGRIGKRYGVDEKTVSDTYRQLEQTMMQADAFTKYSKIIEEALNETAAKLNFEIEPSDFSDVLIAHTTIEPFFDAPTALEKAKLKGYKTVFLTNHSRDLIQSNLVKLQHDFDVIITAEDVQTYKPNIEFFNQVNEQLTNDDVHIHIAVDDQKDLNPAQKVGWSIIKIDRQDDESEVGSLMDAVERI